MILEFYMLKVCVISQFPVLHNRKGVDLQRLRMRQRREAQHTRYRHLYQVRRVNGDVISQVSKLLLFFPPFCFLQKLHANM